MKEGRQLYDGIWDSTRPHIIDANIEYFMSCVSMDKLRYRPQVMKLMFAAWETEAEINRYELTRHLKEYGINLPYSLALDLMDKYQESGRHSIPYFLLSMNKADRVYGLTLSSHLMSEFSLRVQVEFLEDSTAVNGIGEEWSQAYAFLLSMESSLTIDQYCAVLKSAQSLAEASQELKSVLAVQCEDVSFLDCYGTLLLYTLQSMGAQEAIDNVKWLLPKMPQRYGDEFGYITQ